MITAAPSTGFLSAGITAIKCSLRKAHNVRPTYSISWVDLNLEMHQIKARGNNILLCVLLAGCKKKFGELTVDLS